MKSLGIDSDRNAIAEQLAQLDSSDPMDPSQSPEAPSTVRELKAQLDTLLGQLREPVGPDPFAEESGLRRAQELVRAIGVENVAPIVRERPQLGRIGPYELLEKLGEGGMGAVYKALHSSLEKIVALKVLPRDRLHPDAVARFKREMKAVGKLDHPNLVRATDAGEMDGEHFLVMEYVDGVDLSELLRRVGPLAAADACELMRQAAVGLQHAHQRGMVHRDIKPNNIMLTWADELLGEGSPPLGAGLPTPPSVKILDMGLALLSEPAAGGKGDLTSTGQMMGTIEYMSPEQGLDTHSVDHRSDIYSLGATLYKLLCGKAPFSGEKYNTPGKILVALATQQPPSITAQRDDLPAGLAAVVDRMLAKDPAQRYRAAAEVAQALAPYAAGADLPRLSAAESRTPLRDVQESTSPTATADSPNTSPATTKPLLESRTPIVAGTLRVPAFPHTECAGYDLSPNALTATLQPLLARLGKTAYLRPALISIAAALLFLAAATIIRIRTADGTLILTVDDPKVIVEIDGQKALVKQTPNGKALEISVDPGDHTLVVKTADGILLKTDDRFTMEAGGKKQLTAVLERDKPATIVSTPSTNPDRRAAEWVLSIGGTINIQEYGQERPIAAVGDLPRGAFELTRVNLDLNLKVSDAGLAVFKDCKNLTGLLLAVTQVSDVGLAHFKDCKNLAGLGLGSTKVSDAGLAHFKDCENLTHLHLDNTQVSDTGLAHFKDCKNLSFLSLNSTKVSDAGLAHFQNCENLAELSLIGSQVSDASLERLADFPKLNSLSITKTKVTEAGVKKLSVALPRCWIAWDGGVIEPKEPAKK